MLFAFICVDKPNSTELRSRLRVPHLEYMIRIMDRTACGGPLKDDAGEASCGSLFAIEFESRADAEEFIAEEPYNKGGLFESVEIRRWAQMVPESEEGFLLKELARQRALSEGEAPGEWAE